MLTTRFLLRLRSFNQSSQKLCGGPTRSQELSSFAAVPNARGGRRSRGGFSVADEFGEDPLHIVFRAAESATATIDASEPGVYGDSTDRERDVGLRRAAAVEELMRHMRRADESQTEWDHGGTTVGGTESHVEWNGREAGAGADIEAGDGVAATGVADTPRAEASTAQRADLHGSSSESAKLAAPPCGFSSAGVSAS